MAKIQRAVLRQLENLYRFVSGQEGAPTDFELGLGITAVHDLSRMAEIGNANIVRNSAGYWLCSAIQNHVAAGTVTEDLDLVSPGVASEGYALNEREEWVWVINAWLTCTDAADFDAAQILINVIPNDFFIGPSDIQPSSVHQLLFKANDATAEGTMTAAGTSTLTQVANLPALILSPQSGLTFESVSDNAGTVVVTFNVMLWIGLRNTFPPGMY